MLRTAFLFLFLILSLTAGASTENCELSFTRGYHTLKDKLQGAVGGVWSCDSPTARQVREYDCANNFVKLGKLVTASDDLNNISLDMFFQSLAANSHKQANCKVGFFKKYLGDSNDKTLVNKQAADAFNKIQPKFRPLVMERAKLQKLLNDEEMETDRAVRMMTLEGRNQIRTKLGELDKRIVATMTAIPMGYDTDMARVLTQMSFQNKFDPQMYEDGMDVAYSKYKEASQYYAQKYSGGLYCLGLEYKNSAGRSGEIDEWLESLPQRTPSQKNFHDKLQCRLGAHYESGRSRVNTGITIASYATYAFPERWLPAVGATALQVARATKALTGIAAVGAALAIDSAVSDCLPNHRSIAGSGEDCKDPAHAFETVISEPKESSCAVIAANGGYLAFLGLKAGVAGAKAMGLTAPRTLPQAVKSLSSAGSVELYVNGRGRVPLTPESLVAGKTYPIIEREGKIIIGDGYAPPPEHPERIHWSLRQAVTGEKTTFTTKYSGGTIRFNKDGTIDVSGAHIQGFERANILGSQQAQKKFSEILKASGVKGRSTSGSLEEDMKIFGDPF